MIVYFAKVKTKDGTSIMRVKAETEAQAQQQAIKQSLDPAGIIIELRALYTV